MHDCPTCKVPLHGHEEVCPSCGTKQYVRKGFSSERFTNVEKPSLNVMPFVVAAIAIAGVTFFMVQSSWVGRVMNRGPVVEDPMAKMTAPQVRQIFVSKITDNLTAAGAKGKLSWSAAGSPSDMNTNGSVELTINTRLKNKDDRHAIIDPVKDLMGKANIGTLTMIDSKSHATWTYTAMTPSASQGDEGAGDTNAPAGNDQAPPSTNTH